MHRCACNLSVAFAVKREAFVIAPSAKSVEKMAPNLNPHLVFSGTH